MNRKPKKLLLKGARDEKFQLVAIYYIVNSVLSSSHSLPNLLPCKRLLIDAQFVGHSLATLMRSQGEPTMTFTGVLLQHGWEVDEQKPGNYARTKEHVENLTSAEIRLAEYCQFLLSD